MAIQNNFKVGSIFFCLAEKLCATEALLTGRKCRIIELEEKI